MVSRFVIVLLRDGLELLVTALGFLSPSGDD